MAHINRTLGTFVLILSIAIFSHSAFCGTKEEVVYFQNTDYETHVFILKGEKPGHTVLIVSGLHGDESGGFLAAEAFTKVDIKRGELIIISRANLPAIQLRQRHINVDMNRRFFLEGSFADSDLYEDKIVAIIKKYINQSDVVLDLHCGSGFYRHSYINHLENPWRWGQSIIADDDKVYFEDGKEVNLQAIAEQVITYLNSVVKDPRHHYHFNNTRTKYTDSIHPEQRVSLSFYSLYGAKVIAFGLETSKALPLDYYKAYYHICAVKRFLDLFDIAYTGNPKPLFHPPHLKYLLCSINGHLTCIRNKDTVGVPYGASFKVEKVIARFGYPSVVDIPDVEGLNDRGKQAIIDSPKEVLVRKDGNIYASIHAVPLLGFKEDAGLIIKVNGQQRRVSIGETISITPKDCLYLCDVFGLKEKDIKVNLLGFAPPGKSNSGEDRGVLIHPKKARFIHRYAMVEQGHNIYPITITNEKYLLGTLFLKIRPLPLFHPPHLKYLLCSINERLTCIRNKDTVGVPYGASFKVEKVIPDVEGLNDRGKQVIIDSPKEVLVRKDGNIYASIHAVPLLGFKEDAGLIIEVNGQQRRVSIGETISITPKDCLYLCDVFGLKEKDIKVNLLGFAPPGKSNSGEDRGVLIHPKKARFIRRYAMVEQGHNIYPITITNEKYLLGTLFLKIGPIR